MPINVSEAIDSDTAEVVTVTRPGTGSRVDGRWVPVAGTTFTSLCSVQQPTAEDLQILPQGERNGDIRKFISIKKIQGVSDKDGIEADTVSYNNKTYKIISPEDWQAYGHSTCLGARIQ